MMQQAHIKYSFWYRVQMSIHLLNSPNVSFVAPVALLIDGENIPSTFITYILAVAGTVGGVTIRYVYGNCLVQNMKGWQEIAPRYGLTILHHQHPVAGKNTADIALTVGAMDLFQQGIRHFCLATSDSDYIPLLVRLRGSGCLVLGVGVSKAVPALQEAYTTFFPLESTVAVSSETTSTKTKRSTATQTTIPSSQSKRLTSLQKQSKKRTTDIKENILNESVPLSTTGIRTVGEDTDQKLVALLLAGYYQPSEQIQRVSVPIPEIVEAVKQIEPTFKLKAYGQRTHSLALLIKAREDIFLISKEREGVGGIDEVELRANISQDSNTISIYREHS